MAVIERGEEMRSPPQINQDSKFYETPIMEDGLKFINSCQKPK